jgi:integrase
LSYSEARRKADGILANSGVNSEAHRNRIEAINNGLTFQHQAEKWLQHCQTRRRKPIKSATVKTWSNHLRLWINPVIGDMVLSDVNNPALKMLVEKMSKAGRSPKTIHNVAQIVKMVVASKLNDNGEPVFVRSWNSEFLDMPLIRRQRQPSFSAEVLTQIVARSQGQFRMLFALLAGTGMRVGEALALRAEDVSADGSVITISKSVWNQIVQNPKTENALREIDLHPDLAQMLRQFIGGKKTGFLFLTRTGHFFTQTNLLRRKLHPILADIGATKAGFHAFRRARVTQLRRMNVPEDLLRLWIGHSDRSLTDGYSKLKEDLMFRKEWAVKAGLGFEMPPLPLLELSQLSQKTVPTQETVSLVAA